MKPTKKDICYQHMAAAYNEVSSGGKLPAIARMIAYALRRLTGLGDALRFDQVLKGANNTGLLDQYLRDHPVETADWDVVREERGTFSTPEGYNVPLGTIPVRNEIARIARRHSIELSYQSEEYSLTIPKKGPLDDYSGVLYIEKMGFAPLFEATNLLRRRDLAVASSRGFSVRACRALLDFLRRQKVPIFIAHDLHKAGIGIPAMIKREIPSAIDIGLRWSDVTSRALGFARHDLRHRDYSESVDYGQTDPRPNLRVNGATQDEIDFLCDTARPGQFSGRRVELNALPGQMFIDWLEASLDKAGLKRVVPSAAHLEASYRRVYCLSKVNEAIADAWIAARDEADAITVPRNLRTLVRDGLAAFEEQAWDDVIVTLIQDRLDNERSASA